ncbi:MAG: hypothetical protein ACUVUF_02670 [Candidatus Bathycorpusculaceae bacterium]
MFTPFIFVSVVARAYLQAAIYVSFFLIYCYLDYHFVYKKMKAKYPLVPPEGRMDVYFPRTNIPRPIHEDMQRYPEFLEEKGKYVRKWKRRK